MARHSIETKRWSAVLFLVILACGAPADPTSVISSIDLGLTLTRVETDSGLRDEYDLRLSATTNRDLEMPVQSLTLVAPGGATLTVHRSDVAEMDQIDPDFGIEIIRGFEAGGDVGHWDLAAIASLDPELFGDGTYTLTAYFADGSQTVQLWYGEPGTSEPLPIPSNSGFTSPDLGQPLTSPLTFTWNPDPSADYAAVFMAPVEGGEEKEAALPPGSSSFGPHDYAPGVWGFELAIGVERQGILDGVEFSISKGTVLTLDRAVK